jgi:hypothetical protein
MKPIGPSQDYYQHNFGGGELEPTAQQQRTAANTFHEDLGRIKIDDLG